MYDHDGGRDEDCNGGEYTQTAARVRGKGT